MKTLAAALLLAALTTPTAHADDPCNNDLPGCPIFGHEVCQSLDNGLSSGTVAQNAAVAYDLSRFMAASLIAGAIVKYCPQHEGE